MISRLLWVAAGTTWAIRSLMTFANPDYLDPGDAFDRFAIWSFSLGFLLLAAAIVASPSLTPSRGSRGAALVVAGASFVAGIANALEDGFEIGAMFGVFAVSALIALYGPAVVAATLARAGQPRLAGWWAGVWIGLFTFPAGGSVIVLGMALVLALRPRWLSTPAEPVPAPT